MLRTRLATVALFVVLAALDAPAGTLPPAAEGCAATESSRTRWLMGTVLEVRLRGSDPALADAVFDAVAEVERAASTWREDTELSAIHRAGGGAFGVSEPLAEVLDAAFRAREATRGSFEPALGALVNAYDLHGAGRWPSERELHAALGLASEKSVRWHARERRLVVSGEGVRLDLDGIAKGVALDRAARRLRAAGVTSALLNFGGQVLVIGPPPGCPEMEIVVAAPDASARPLATIRIRDGSVSTSSNSERRRLVEGRPFGHLLDPRTGRFASFDGAVSVAAPTAAEADALSTALFVLGPGSGLPVPPPRSFVFAVPDGNGAHRIVAAGGFRPPGGASR